MKKIMLEIAHEKALIAMISRFDPDFEKFKDVVDLCNETAFELEKKLAKKRKKSYNEVIE